MATATAHAPVDFDHARPLPVHQEPGLLGNYRAFRKDPLALTLKVLRETGEVASLPLFSYPLVMVASPEGAEQILVRDHRHYDKKTRGYDRLKWVLGKGLLTAEGETWRANRRLAQPAFHHQRLAGFADVMVLAADEVTDRWTHGQVIDVSEAMMEATLRVVGETMLSIDTRDAAHEVGETLEYVLDFVNDRISNALALPPPWPTPSNRRFARNLGRLDKVINGVIAERRAKGVRAPEDGGDLLDMLMSARDEETGEGLSDLELRDEAMTIFLAGHETTAMALTWTLWQLADAPNWIRRIEAELDTVLAGRRPRLEDLRSLEVTTRVLKESMRLRPPAWIIGRRPTVRDVVDGYRIEPEGAIFTNPWVLHRNPRVWPDPDRFDPDRFLPEAEESRHRLAYMPFGAGPRKCIGEGFAMMEATLMLASLLSRYRFERATDAELGMRPLITLRPDGPARMRLTAR